MIFVDSNIPMYLGVIAGHADAVKELRGDAALLVEQAEQKVFRADVRVSERSCGSSGQLEDALRA